MENNSSNSQPVTNPTTDIPVQPPPTPMKPAQRRVPIALYLTLIVAILMTGLAYGFNRYMNNSVTKEVAVTPVVQPFFLTITSPQNNVTSVNDEIIVSGKTLPDTAVMIYSDTDETSVVSDAKGMFESSITIDEADGVIKITAFGDKGEEKSETIIVGKTNEISYMGSDVLGKSTTAPGQIKKATTNPTTVKIETVNTNKVKISPTPKQVKEMVVKTNKVEATKINTFLQTKTEKVKPEKIGSAKIREVLSLEATNSSMVKNTIKLEKMLAREATPATQMKRHAVSGVITAISGETITISHQTQQERVFTIYTNAVTTVAMKDTEDATVADLAVGMRIAAVGEPINDGLLAKRIHIIPGKAVGLFNKYPVATETGVTTLTPSPEATETASPTLTPTEDVTIAETPTETPTVEDTPTGTPTP